MQDDRIHCSGCDTTKSRDDFYSRANGKPRKPCRACMSQAASAWAKANPERVQASNARNIDKRRAENRERHERNKADPAYREAARQRASAWREANRDKHRSYSLEWQQKNRSAYRASMRRHQRIRRLGRDEEAVAYADVLRGDPCAYCGGPCEHIDHIVPVANEGTNEWCNLTAACASCNSRKQVRSLLEWMLCQDL